MIKTEYVRNLNRNYLRVMPESRPDYKRYQYCILSRGGIKYLLMCNCKNIDGEGYLDYDVSSSQNVKQMFSDKCIHREWMKAFFWGMQKMQQELTRFLLDERNIVWSPEYIFQDLERNDFLFLYLPYEGQEGCLEEDFEKLLEFWVEKIDYSDEVLSEFVYHAYEQYIGVGENYLEKQIFEDFKNLVENAPAAVGKTEEKTLPNVDKTSKASVKSDAVKSSALESSETPVQEENNPEKKGILSFLEGRKRKQEQKNIYREEMRRMINGYAVCEESVYGKMSEKEEKDPIHPEEYGRTIYIEETEAAARGLYTEKGELAVRLEKFPFVVGKRKEDADYVLSDYSASRVHARFAEEEDGIYLEDLNSTNGTFKNGLRMQPYEKRKLEPEDVLRFGKSTYVFK